MLFYISMTKRSTSSGERKLSTSAGRRRVYNEAGFSDQPHRYSIRDQFGPSDAPATPWVAGCAHVGWHRTEGMESRGMRNRWKALNR